MTISLKTAFYLTANVSVAVAAVVVVVAQAVALVLIVLVVWPGNYSLIILSNNFITEAFLKNHVMFGELLP